MAANYAGIERAIYETERAEKERAYVERAKYYSELAANYRAEVSERYARGETRDSERAARISERMSKGERLLLASIEEHRADAKTRASVLREARESGESERTVLNARIAAATFRDLRETSDR